MSTYCCNCVNVIINVRRNETRPVDCKSLLTDTDDEELDKFFAGKLLEVKLAMSGIETQHPFLVESRHLSNWEIIHCCICHMDVYTINTVKGMDHVVMNGLLQCDNVKTLQTDDRFSPAYKILVSPKAQRKVDLSAQTHFTATVSASQAKVSGLAKRFLRSQEEAMYERIRIYTENEKMRYAEIKARTTKDQQLMLNSITDYEEARLKNSISNVSSEEKRKPRSPSKDETDDVTALPIIKGRPKRPHSFDQSNTNSDPVSIRNSLPSRILSSQPTKILSSSMGTTTENKMMPIRTRRKSDSDDTVLFDLDGFRNQDCVEPFFESDDDSSVDSNSFESSGGYHPSLYGSSHGHLPFGNDRVYASSVPIHVPVWRSSDRHNSDHVHEKDLERVPSPDKMAASMKALARSVGMHDTTTMFGELPRPRVHTMPYR